MNKNRLEAFSDGVFAIAITLLILVIHIPQPSELHNTTLFVFLMKQWQSYVGFVLSFILIGIVWINHHTMFSYIKKTNHVLNIINLFLLMNIAFLPFPTALLALYIGQPHAQQTSIMVYSGALAEGGIFFNLIWWYALRSGLVEKGKESEELHALGKKYVVGPILYFIAFLLSFFFNGTISILFCIFLALFYLVPPFVSRPSK
jgi:uncharacterized membrane protein